MEAPAQTSSSPGYLSSWRLCIVITSLFFGAFLIALDTNIINVAVPRISDEFHSLQDVAWYGTAYLLTITAFQPIYGSLYKYFNTDVVYRMSIMIFECKSNPLPSSDIYSINRIFSGHNSLRSGHILQNVHRGKSCCGLGSCWRPARCAEHHWPGS